MLRKVVERALPRLVFSDPDQALAGHEMLWMLNLVWAKIESKKGESQCEQ